MHLRPIVIAALTIALAGPLAGFPAAGAAPAQSDPSIVVACPPDLVPDSGLSDIASSVHRDAIDCMVWLGTVNGFADGTFRPDEALTRGQAASLTARALQAGGVTLPSTPPDSFPDDEGSVHEANIDFVAAAGLFAGTADGRFLPGAPLTRAQVATLIVRAWEPLTGAPLPAGSDAFDDDEGSVHEPAIDAVAAAGIVQGTAPGRFDPNAPVLRGQAATIVARIISS